MNSPLLLAALLLGPVSFLTLNAAADKPSAQQSIPEKGFADAAEMQRWSASSAVGGGSHGEIQLSGEKVFWSKRSMASGRALEELVFWKHRKDRLVPWLVVPVHMTEYSVAEKDGRIVVRAWDHKTRAFEPVLTLEPRLFAPDL